MLIFIILDILTISALEELVLHCDCNYSNIVNNIIIYRHTHVLVKSSKLFCIFLIKLVHRARCFSQEKIMHLEIIKCSIIGSIVLKKIATMKNL